MRKLLNTIYVTNEAAYLTLDGENLVCKIDGEIKLRIPFENVENIVCFNYVGCSPALMGKCVGEIPCESLRRNKGQRFLKSRANRPVQRERSCFDTEYNGGEIQQYKAVDSPYPA